MNTNHNREDALGRDVVHAARLAMRITFTPSSVWTHGTLADAEVSKVKGQIVVVGSVRRQVFAVARSVSCLKTLRIIFPCIKVNLVPERHI